MSKRVRSCKTVGSSCKEEEEGHGRGEGVTEKGGVKEEGCHGGGRGQGSVTCKCHVRRGHTSRGHMSVSHVKGVLCQGVKQISRGVSCVGGGGRGGFTLRGHKSGRGGVTSGPTSVFQEMFRVGLQTLT